jgi:hypothetical protein
MELKEILDEIRTKPAVPLWPHVGKALGIARGSVYAAADRGEIDVLEIGRRKLAITASLRRKLGMDASPQVGGDERQR